MFLPALMIQNPIRGLLTFSASDDLGVPLLLLLLPLVTLLKPILPVALMLTLLLTAFACAYIALSLVKGDIERGVVILGGAALAMFDAWLGLLISVVATPLLVGFQRDETEGSDSSHDLTAEFTVKREPVK